MSKVLRIINDTGIGIKSSDERDKIQDIRVYAENGSVQLWVELKNDSEYFQYLNSREAMALSEVLAKLAIEALRNESGFRY